MIPATIKAIEPFEGVAGESLTFPIFNEIGRSEVSVMTPALFCGSGQLRVEGISREKQVVTE